MRMVGQGTGLRVLLINGQMGMCHRMGSHFHFWIDYNEVAFSTEFPTELLECGCKLSGFWEEKCWLVGFKNGKIRGIYALANAPERFYCRSKVKCSSSSSPNVSLHFRTI